MKVLAKSSVGIILALLCGVSSSFAQGYKEAGLHISHYNTNYDGSTYGFIGRYFLGFQFGIYRDSDIGDGGLQLVSGVNISPRIENFDRYEGWGGFDSFWLAAPLMFSISVKSNGTQAVGLGFEAGISNEIGTSTYYEREYYLSEQIRFGPIATIKTDGVGIRLSYHSYGRYLFRTDFDDYVHWPWESRMDGGDNSEISINLLVDL